MPDPNTHDGVPKKEPFRLSYSNKVMLVVLLGVYLLIHVSIVLVRASRAASSESRASVIGEGLEWFFIITILLAVVPSVLAGLSWYLGPRSKPLSSAAFNVVISCSAALILALSFAGNRMQYKKRAQPAEFEAAAEAAKMEYKKAVLAGEDISEVGKKNDKLLMDSLGRWTASESGEDKKILQAATATLNELMEVKQRYRRAADAFESEEVLDMTIVKEQSELKRQRAIIVEYAEAASEFASAYASYEDRVQANLEKAGADSELSRSVLGDVRGRTGGNKPLVLRSLTLAAQFGQVCTELIDLFDSNWGKWSYSQKTGGFEFEAQSAVKDFNRITKKMAALEDSINENQKKILERL